jgi:ABC-type uncharacterized transport system substrate-binding protein
MRRPALVWNYSISKRATPPKSTLRLSQSSMQRQTPCSWHRTATSQAEARNWPLSQHANRIPTSDFVSDAAAAGLLMSYGTSVPDVFRQAAIYTGSILKGVKPADLPVLQSSKFEFILNLQTARSLRIDIPPTLLARADAVIE